MLKSADVLILDEPTNDLDIDTLEVLEASLLEFPGAIIMVSHDRHLLTKVCTHFLGIDGQGGYSAVASYEQWEKEIFKGRGGAREIAAPSGKSERKQKKLSFKEQFELKETEGLIAKTEERILILERRLEQSSGKGDAGQTASLYAELTAERNILERTYMRWADLEEKKSNLDL
jgi:ATP-binding cassette subfamily F protein uup